MTDQPEKTPQANEAKPPEEPAPEVEEQNEESPSLIARLGVGGFVRLMIGILGVSGFVVGVLIAWDSTSATTLLIVSAILLVLAALGLDWSEIRGTGPGGWTFQLLRHVGERIEQVAAGENVPQAIREELESVRAEVKALTPPERGRRSRRPAPAFNAGTFEELFRTKATHSFRGTDAAQLHLRASSRSDARYRCTVKTPNEREFSAVAPRPLMATGFPNTYTVVYPDDFNGSEPLVPGRYEVAWRAAPLVDPLAERTSRLTQALAQTMGTPLATNSFTIPEEVRTERQRGVPSEPRSAENPQGNEGV